MFDPSSESFLHQAPELPGLRPESLPGRFTNDYAQLAVARVRGSVDENANIGGWSLGGIADAYELITTTSADPSVREPAAFVAATAQQLLAQASTLGQENSGASSSVTRDAVAPEVAAPLLFLISRQFADAADAASRITVPSGVADCPNPQLIKAIKLLAQGRVMEIVELRESESRPSGDLYRQSEESIQLALARAVKSVARSLVGSQGEDPREQLTQILEACDGPVRTLGRMVSSYPGYQQAARLLLLAYDALEKSALVGVPAPPTVDGLYWERWLHQRASIAPFVWPNHVDAVRAGFHYPGNSAVLVLPTGAGKTTLASMKVAGVLSKGLRVIVLAPTNALVEQLSIDLSDIFPGQDLNASAISSSSLISVMTPERCLALLSFQPSSFDDVALVIFDEAHLLSTESGSRRSIDAMLAVLMLVRRAPQADLLFLSAMLRNGSELAEWIGEITGRPSLFFDPLWKPSRQARGVVMYQERELDTARNSANVAQDVENRRVGSVAKTVRSAAKKELRLTPFGIFGLENNWLNEATANVTIQKLTDGLVDLSGKLKDGVVEFTPSVNQVAKRLAQGSAQSGLKTIVFANVRNHTVSIAHDLRAQLGDDASAAEADFEMWEDLATELGGLEYAYNSPSDLAVCHNGLMLRVERSLAERSFRRADGAKVIAATPTLAQGMNLPADVAILASEMRASSGEGREPLSAHELMNAAARAGRAGHVANGLVILISENVLSFDPEDTLDRQVVDRLKAILPDDDRSIYLQDPLQGVLDRLSAGLVEDPDVEYLLNRLSLEGELGSHLSINLSTRSFAAFQAARSGIDGEFQQQIQHLRAVVEGRVAGLGADDPLRVVGAQTGLSREILVALEERLNCDASWPMSIPDWIAWVFSWLRSSSFVREQMFGTETGSMAQSVGKSLSDVLSDEDLLRLQLGAQEWVSGAPLIDIEEELVGDTGTADKKCKRARVFVTRAVPQSIAFAVGVVVLVARGLERELTPSAELVLDCLVHGVRDGFDRPALVAFAHTKGRRDLRVRRHREFEAYSSVLRLEGEPGSLEELIDLVRSNLPQDEYG